MITSPFNGAYSATKFALEALSDALRYELKPSYLKVVLLQPGKFSSSYNDRIKEAGSPLLDKAHSTVQKQYTAFLNEEQENWLREIREQAYVKILHVEES